MRDPLFERPHTAGMGGVQKIYRFPNGYGASVVRFPYSYGYELGLWELAVIKFNGKGADAYSLTYETDITDDVIGHLSGDEVDEILSKIEGLNKEEKK